MDVLLYRVVIGVVGVGHGSRHTGLELSVMPMSEAAEFRALCQAMQWDAAAFARAAGIKQRTATAIWRGEREAPAGLMAWLRGVVSAARAVPPPPQTDR